MSDLLPPAVQAFIVDSAGYISGIDEMIAVNVRLAESITAVMDEMRAMEAMAAKGGELGAVGAGAGASAAGSQELIAAQQEVAAASEGAATAQTALADAERTAGDAATVAAEKQKLLGDAEKSAAAASAAVVKASEEITVAEKASGDAAVSAGAKQEAGAAKTNASGAVMDKFGKVAKVALLGFGAAAVYGVDKAMKFNAETTRLYTAAGLTKASFGQVSAQLLQLGNQYGYTGEEMAKAMYHPVSAGLDLSRSLKVVAESANLANIHGANLEDTTYALSSVMKAYNVQASDVTKTSGLLNAIVGQGDMRFQDFNQSIKNWTPTGAAMGISIQSMGSALAYLTDRGNSAEVASTRMTMGLSMVTSGSKAANVYLKDLGLTTGTLSLKNQSLQKTMQAAGLTTNKVAADLKKPDGIYVALKDIQDSFRKAGLSASQADQVMAKIFGGGRSDKAIMALMQNLDGVKQKYGQIGAAVSDYGRVSAQAAKTPQQQWKDFKATLTNLATSFGTLLLPAVTKALSGLNKFLGGLQKNKGEAKALVTIIAGLAGAMALGKLSNMVKSTVEGLTALGKGIKKVAEATKIWEGIQAAFNIIMDANPIMLIVIGIAALVAGVIYAYTHFKTFRDIVNGVFEWMKTAVMAVINFVAGHWRLIISIMLGPMGIVISLVTKYWRQILDVVIAVWDAIKSATVAAWNYMKKIIMPPVMAIQVAIHAAFNLMKTIVVDTWHIIYAVIFGKTQDVKNAISAFGKDVKKAWESLWMAVRVVVTDVWKSISTVVNDAIRVVKTAIVDAWHFLKTATVDTWHAIYTGVSDAVKAVWTAIKAAWDFIVRITNDTVKGIWTAIKAAWDFVVRITKDAWNAWVNAIRTTLNGAYDLIRALPGNILRILGNIGTLLITVGHNLIIGLWNGITSMGSWLWNQITGWVKSFVMGPINSILHIFSPSRWAHSAGQFVGQGLANGITSTFGLVSSAAAGLAKQVTNGLSAPLYPRRTRAQSINMAMTSPEHLAAMGNEAALNAAQQSALGWGQSTAGGVLGQQSSGWYMGSDTYSQSQAPTQPVVVNVYNAGSVLSQRDLESSIQQAVLQVNVRNPTNMYSLPGGR